MQMNNEMIVTIDARTIGGDVHDFKIYYRRNLKSLLEDILLFYKLSMAIDEVFFRLKIQQQVIFLERNGITKQEIELQNGEYIELCRGK